MDDGSGWYYNDTWLTSATNHESLDLDSILDNSTMWLGMDNFSTAVNETGSEMEELALAQLWLGALLLAFSLATVVGNALVIAAVVRERALHTVTNYFIMSLAVADGLVGLVVMPFSAAYEALDKKWPFGVDWCDAWHSLDVLASTASILNLCAISLDRYLAVTDPFTYPSRLSPTRAAFLVALVWICSALISFPAVAWWRAVRTTQPPPLKCPFTEDVYYLLFSSVISFYGPLTVMLFTYYRVYRAAAEQTRSLRMGTKQVILERDGEGETELTLRIHRGGSGRLEHTAEELACLQQHSSSPPNGTTSKSNHHHHHHLHHHACSGPPASSLRPGASLRVRSATLKPLSLSRRLAKFAKERKAAKTLGIVMGVFIMCWLPFFVVNLLSGFCQGCMREEELIGAIVTWLGWCNSGMNPVIYACWARDFRRAFARILCTCCPRKIRRRYQRGFRGKLGHFSQSLSTSATTSTVLTPSSPTPVTAASSRQLCPL